jgi:hypothetical protein
VLRSARLVSVRREGLYAHYALADLRVFRPWQTLRDPGQARLAELDRVVAEYLGRRDETEAVGADELLRRRDGGRHSPGRPPPPCLVARPRIRW